MCQILERAKYLIRVFLATVDFFPDPKDTDNVTITCFDEACLDTIGRRAKCTSCFLISPSIMTVPNSVHIL